MGMTVAGLVGVAVVVVVVVVVFGVVFVVVVGIVIGVFVVVDTLVVGVVQESVESVEMVESVESVEMVEMVESVAIDCVPAMEVEYHRYSSECFEWVAQTMAIAHLSVVDKWVVGILVNVRGWVDLNLFCCWAVASSAVLTWAVAVPLLASLVFLNDRTRVVAWLFDSYLRTRVNLRCGVVAKSFSPPFDLARLGPLPACPLKI